MQTYHKPRSSGSIVIIFFRRIQTFLLRKWGNTCTAIASTSFVEYIHDDAHYIYRLSKFDEIADHKNFCLLTCIIDSR